MLSGSSAISSLTHLFFPNSCCGCDSDLLAPDAVFCPDCFSRLPFTFFESISANPVERLFFGRADIVAASALFYFTEGSGIRKSLHRFKYGGVQQIGVDFGRWMAERIKSSSRFANCDQVIALPLHPSKLRKRGYNQAAVLAGSLAAGLDLTVSSGNLVRRRAAGSQTSQNRMGRWRQIYDSFRVLNPEALENRHLLLVDDVITTGSTLEAAARVLLGVKGVKLSLAALACSVEV